MSSKAKALMRSSHKIYNYIYLYTELNDEISCRHVMSLVSPLIDVCA